MEPLAITNPDRFREILEKHWLTGVYHPNKREAVEYLTRCGVSSLEAPAFYISLPLHSPSTFGIPEVQDVFKGLRWQSGEDVKRVFSYTIGRLYPTFDIRIRLEDATWTMSFRWSIYCTGTHPDIFETLPSEPAGFDKIHRPKDIPAQNFLVDSQATAYPLVSMLREYWIEMRLIDFRSKSATCNTTSKRGRYGTTLIGINAGLL
jgi:hypothetical protein